MYLLIVQLIVLCPGSIVEGKIEYKFSPKDYYNAKDFYYANKALIGQEFSKCTILDVKAGHRNEKNSNR